VPANVATVAGGGLGDVAAAGMAQQAARSAASAGIPSARPSCGFSQYSEPAAHAADPPGYLSDDHGGSFELLVAESYGACGWT